MVTIRTILTTLAAVTGLSVLVTEPVAAQTCFFYSDNEPALTTFQCVQKATLAPPCAWPEDCTAIPSSASQTVLQMHTAWHTCFGNVGGATPPVGRGQRWYAFHRQFEFDFNRWRSDNGFLPIEQLDWYPGMNLPVRHAGAGLASGTLPNNCGTRPGRPANVPCDLCETFPQCLFYPGGGPIGSPSPPSPSCSAGAVSFAHTSLDQFPNVDDIAKVLDARFHGVMHAAAAIADQSSPTCNLSDSSGCTYNQDLQAPACSPRDPMFWRLHKALDDVVRAWQDGKAVDVMMVIDRSGSMADADVSGETKFTEALQAVDYYADLLENTRADGQVNRVGIVTYSSGATVNLPLTPADATLRAPGGAFATALAGIEAAGPSGCTGIGAGIEKALEQLCPNGGDCRLNLVPAPAGTNARKAILLLTDGLENRPPCLNAAGATPNPVCGSQCFGAQLDYDRLEFTQMVNLGFGQAGGLNSELLTLLAERQGGIYAQNPDGPTDDLKYFFTMAFGQLTDEFVFADPRGRLLPRDFASDAVEYPACGLDAKLTFASGWKKYASPRDLRLLVTTPAGALVRPGAAPVEAGRDSLWEFFRVPLPHSGEAGGTWRAQLIRPHAFYVNGFAPDAIADMAAGELLVRRQVQRLCPDGCRRVLFYEQGRMGKTSAYELALTSETGTGLLGQVVTARDPVDFARQLREGWDLVVYARMGDDRPEPYDALLSRRLCARRPAIITDTRARGASALFKCAGLQSSQVRNWNVMTGDGRLWNGSLKLANPGHPIMSYGLISGSGVQATIGPPGDGAAIVARGDSGRQQDWFIDVLGQGLGKLSPVQMRLSWRTGDELLASARILPSYHHAGGYDHVDARVEVEYPLVGVGSLLSRGRLADSLNIRGELLDRRAATLAGLDIPTATAVFPLYDDGSNGDQHPSNGQWTGKLVGLGGVDGTYRFRFIFDLTAGGCTTRREVAHSIYVDLNVDPGSSGVRVGLSDSLNGRRVTQIHLRPADRYGNLWGPGRPDVKCGPGRQCVVQKVQDVGDGSYVVTVATTPGVTGVKLDGYGSHFHVPIPCRNCARLASVELERKATNEHAYLTGEVRLTEPAPSTSVNGALVYLTSSVPLTAEVPDSVVVPAGTQVVTFPIRVLHAHDAPVEVRISAHYGGEVRTRPLFVRPLTGDSNPPPPPSDTLQRRPDPTQQQGRPGGSPGESSGGSMHGAQPATPTSGDGPVLDPRQGLRVETVGSPAVGDTIAPVVLIEFSDYQCPFCGKFFHETYPGIFDAYIKLGKIRYVFRDAPIEAIHPLAFKAAEAAHCAGDQSAYWGMHDLLFTNQRALGQVDLLAYARRLSLDLDRFSRCLDSGKHAGRVRQSLSEGRGLSINGTPTFFVGLYEPGRTSVQVLDVITGAHPLPVFEAVLERAMARVLSSRGAR